MWFKPRSKLGRWLDERGIKQQDLSKRSGVSEDAITRLANKDDAKPTWRTRKRLMDAISEYDEDVRSHDFWD